MKKINLHNLPKKESFPPPEGYFDTLSERITEKIEQEEKAHPPFQVRWSVKKTLATLGAAASIVAMLWFTWPARQENIETDSLQQVNNAAIIGYLDTQEISVMDLAEHPEAEVLLDSLARPVVPEISDDEIIKTLLEQNTNDAI